MSSAAKVITLPQDFQAFAEERVRAGEYANVDEVTHEAFRLLQLRDERKQHVREELLALFGEMAGGSYTEPSDEELEQAVLARAEPLR